MVLGDDQIMGQIKSAYAASREAGITGKLLHRLVDRALASGKLVRTRTHITSHPVSVVSVALDQAEQHLGGLVRAALPDRRRRTHGRAGSQVARIQAYQRHRSDQPDL